MASLDLPIDADLQERNQKRVEELKQRMGQSYLCHPSNFVRRVSKQVNLAQMGGMVLRRPAKGIVR